MTRRTQKQPARQFTAEQLAAFEAEIREDERQKIKRRQTGWERGGKRHVLDVYARLHEGKLGMHWLWAAVERIAAKVEGEVECMEDFGYAPISRVRKPPSSDQVGGG